MLTQYGEPSLYIIWAPEHSTQQPKLLLQQNTCTCRGIISIKNNTYEYGSFLHLRDV